MEINQMIKTKRKEHKLTQEQLAEKIFVSKKTISNWETGKTTPDIDSLIRLARLFNLSLDTILLEESTIVKDIRRKTAASKSLILFIIPFLANLLILFKQLVLLHQSQNNFPNVFLIFCCLFANLLPLTYYYLKMNRNKYKNRYKPYFYLAIGWTALFMLVWLAVVLLLGFLR
ncbi:helix-turn-helix domain-containing protein [Candidatus Enterococcus ferrettii]|uniref:HTH cro/C1-type domain-containing protein n=1 Tax=Candidatus Enterococcus ferrettii TaxID=2815324 RepID=A0ABV0ELS4_9ENTE|nr:helix-turn-helix transcriptional regulator [Enterococcus sp. 665A]MBO1338172.1 helix-turn-helix domain-containing protein [Enterococcus sp. 665A]